MTEPAALAGIRVVDLTTVVFGPYATQTLADYGADVIKVETPEGDSTRYTGPAVERGMSTIYLGANRNKRSVVIDLKTAAGREAMRALIGSADVFIHNVRPQKLEGLGLSAEALRAANPRLVFVGLHGFGEGGPYAGRPAYDDIIQALSGAADLMLRQSGAPGYLPTIAADKTCGLMAVNAVIAALFQRERTGRGQVIEVPMFEGMVSFLMVEHFYARHLPTGRGETPQPGDLGYPRTLASWRRPFRTADGHVCLMPYTDGHWQRFFASAGRDDLAADPRFATITTRTENIGALYALAGDIAALKPTAHWLALCEELEIPCAPIVPLHELEQDPHLASVDFFHDTAEGYRFPRNPVRFSDSAVEPAMPPRLGEHTAEVLGALGLPPETLAAVLAAAPVRAGA